MNQITTTAQLPTAFTEQQLQKARNNNYAAALASGDPRFAVKAYDRAGISRGAGSWNQAGIDSAKNMQEGIAKAYAQDLANNQYNASTALQGQQSQEANWQALNGLQQQNDYANQTAQLQRQNMVYSLLGGLLNS